MPAAEARSLTQVALLEAVARRTLVQLAAASADGGERRLQSRFLGTAGDEGRLAVDVPRGMPQEQGQDKKVFLRTNTAVVMTFRVGELALEAATEVVGHCQFATHATHRADACLLARPKRLRAVNQRSEPRVELDPQAGLVMASIWALDGQAFGNRYKPWLGRLRNRSGRGLAVSLPAPLPYEPLTKVVIRLEPVGTQTQPIYRATLRHCSRGPDGEWIAGFDELAELRPGEAVELVAVLAAEAPQ